MRVVLLFVLALLAATASAQFRAGTLKAAAGHATKTLPDLGNGLRREYGDWSQKKREILQTFVEEHFLKRAPDGRLPLAANADDYAIMEGFSGPGYHYSNAVNGAIANDAKGSPVGMIEGAITNGFIPHFWFNDASAEVIAHLTSVVEKVAAEALLGGDIATLGALTDRVTYSTANFGPTFSNQLATDARRGQHIYAHIDPFRYDQAPWDDVRAIFADNPQGKIRALSMNLFASNIVGDLGPARTSADVCDAPAMNPNHDNVRSIATYFGFAGDGRGQAFLDAMSQKFYDTYHEGDAVEGLAAQRAWGAEQICIHLRFMANNNNQFRRANAVSRVAAEVYADQIAAIDPDEIRVAPSKVALIPNIGNHGPYVMYWLIFASNDPFLRNDMEAIFQAKVPATSKHGAQMFLSHGQHQPGPNVGQDRTQGDHDQFLSIQETVKWKPRRSRRSVKFADALEAELNRK